jgi:acyl-coenzyme A synthetase/AMP-(fatty) acid ligase
MSEELDYEKAYREWKWRISEKYNIGRDVVDKHAESKERKNRVALYCENEKGEEKKLTFSDLRSLSNKFGNALLELGIKKNDRFLIRLSNVPEFQVSFIGGVKIGAVPIPSSVLFRPKEIEYRINDSGAKAVITTPEYVNEVEEIKDVCKTLQNIIVVGETSRDQISYKELMKTEPESLELADTKSNDMAFFCYTSGTTGSPKGTVHLHRWLLGNDPSGLYWQAYKDDDIAAHTGALSWIFTLGNGFLYAWRQGVPTFLYDGRFDPEKWFSLIEKYHLTNFASVPTCYRMLVAVKGAEERYNLSSLRHCISAGEPLNPEVVIEWKKRFGVDIVDGIGMTEMMVYTGVKGIKVKPGSMGRLQPGHVCSIVDPDGNELPSGAEGTIGVSGEDPGLFKEYWNKPEATKESFKRGWFMTGDIARVDEDGYYWFLGRGDDLIKASGYRISPFEVESAVNSHPAVLESAAIASPDPTRGAIVKSFVVLKKGHGSSEKLAREIQDHVKKIAAPYMYPRAIEFVDELPKTQSGKIMRKVLREAESAKAKK